MKKRLPNLQDRITLERFTGSDYCEERKLLAYTTSLADGVILKNIETGETTLLSGSGADTFEKAIREKSSSAARSPRFSTDGTKLLYVKQGLQCYDLHTKETFSLGSFTGPVIDPMWSPDGTKILFASTQGSSPAPKRRKDEPVVIEDFGYKFDGAGFIRPDSHTHLFLMDAATGALTQLTHGVHDQLHHNWSPDGTWITYVSNEQRPSEESIGYDLFVQNLEGEKRMISGGLWMVSYPNPIRPVFTADNGSVIMGALNPQADTTLGYPDIVFFRFPVDGSEPKLIFQASQDCYQCVQFPYNAGCGWGMDKVQLSPDGKALYFVSGWKGQGNLYKLDLENKNPIAKTVWAGKHVIHGLGRIQNGKMLVSRSEIDLPEAYYLLDIKSDTVVGKAVQSAETLTEEVFLGQAEDFFFDTLDGEGSVHGWAQPPLEYAAGISSGKKYPAILYIHGGPHPFYTYGLTMEFQCLASEGFGILYCNPRGSSSYGPAHQNVKRAMDGSAYIDCLQFVEEAIRRFDWIDPGRIGVTGGSYGGYMTNYIATHAKRFKAYVTQRSVVNSLISYASSDMQGQSKHFDSFEEFMIHELKESPVSYAERIDRPLLILHGQDDYRTPVEGAHQLFVAVKDLHPDLPVKLVIYPHVSHDQPEDAGQLAHYYKEMVEWFKTYL